ncbi:hypothetical protein [Actinokineospora sp. NBRC 105648]|uniref:hypothetical protein n=1 Tax=Actinokineospora sp. NBRC 105648 TaxID=3032206 RepID=UPI0024A49911|nr:hypothetical protein [Actinokineospora sp. NBRC 105648]GLZ41254.1 hypothetical protein Acsp05_48780 [Actinokineospora sp. NBRC 105648]
MSRYPAEGESTPARPRRKRVVLADSRAPVTVLRTVVELEEQTSWAEEVVRGFIRTQFWTAVRLALIIAVVFGSLPLVFFLAPGLSGVTVAGVSLPWLLLGVLPFPLLFGIGYWYNVLAERHERDFVDMVEK